MRFSRSICLSIRTALFLWFTVKIICGFKPRVYCLSIHFMKVIWGYISPPSNIFKQLLGDSEPFKRQIRYMIPLACSFRGSLTQTTHHLLMRQSYETQEKALLISMAEADKRLLSGKELSVDEIYLRFYKIFNIVSTD